MAMCSHSHIFSLPNLFCWNDLYCPVSARGSCSFGQQQQPLLTTVFTHSCSFYIFGLLLKWEGNVPRCSVTLEASFHHMNSFKRTSFLSAILMEVTFSILSLQVYIYMMTLGIIQSALKILCFNQSCYFLILQTIWHHKAHSRADIFKAWH